MEEFAERGRFYTMGEIERATGVPAATIRAWERRYGVPKPGRSAGRHRLYSEQDLSLLRWLMARQQEGMSISRAIAMWRQQASRGAAPSPETALASTVPRHGLDDLRTAWTAATLRFDRRLAQSLLTQAFALYSLQEVCVEMLLKGLSEIGDAWFRGVATVQQEHFASAVAVNQIERLIAAASPWRQERILLACPPGELHSFGLLFLALLLRQRGLDTVFLGASVPIDRIDSTVSDVHPSLAILSAQRLPDAAALIAMARGLSRLGVPVGYGGLIFNQWPELRECVPAHFLGEAIPGAPDVVERLLSDRPPVPQPASPPAVNADALRSYLLALPAIEADVRAVLGQAIPEAVIGEANGTISSHIVAGLEIGALSPLNAGRPWLEAAFHDLSDPPATMRSFLAGYRLAARSHLSGPVGPILDWLKEATRS